MTFHFSTCRRTRTVSREQVAVSGSGIQHTLASTDSIDNRLRRRCYSPFSIPGGSQDVHDIRTDAYAPWILGGSSVEPSPVSSQGSVSYSSSPPRYRYATHDIKLEILVQVMDASLRRMMSDYRPVRPGGVLLSSDAGFPKLAAISPALFSPGYVKVPQVIELHDVADGLIPGVFAVYWATSHDSTHSGSGASPHRFQSLETQAQAITRVIT